MKLNLNALFNYSTYMRIGYKHSLETRKKISQSNMRHIVSEETKEKIRLFRRGYKFSDESKKKMSEAQMGNKKNLGKKHTLETREKISEVKKSKNFKFSDETKQKMSESKLKKPTNYWLGKKRLNMSGNKHPNWRGGVTKTAEKVRKSGAYMEWRKTILERDDFTCLICNVRGGKLNVDHYPKMFSQIMNENIIDSLEKAIDCNELWETSNGRTLCEPCHKLTPTYLRNFKKEIYV